MNIIQKWMFTGLGMVSVSGAVAAETTWAEDINLEAHGFASFGYLDTSHNNWLGPTRNGSTQFWEAGANVIARPIDRLRIGAQVFARDLVKYDNGKPTLDWAYADYRATDEIGLQAGRFKLPLGLYNESLDIDATRASVFLAPAVYALRSRDLFISADGAKLYGLIDIGAAGQLEYAAFGGAKEFSNDAGFATYVAELGIGDRIEKINMNWLVGGMCHWHTPVSGLGLRVSGFYVDDFYAEAEDTINIQDVETHADYWFGYLSLIYELPTVTFASEYLRIHGRGESVFTPGIPGAGSRFPLIDNGEGAYVNATWHIRKWLDLYGGFEGAWADAKDRDGKHVYSGVCAANIMPLSHWSFKIEYRYNQGTMGINRPDNPDGITNHWQVVALKTTVDF